MKVVVLNGSPRKQGNTSSLVKAFEEGAKSKGHDVAVLRVADEIIAPCKGCNACCGNGRKCAQSDNMEAIYEILETADVLVVATPLYFYGASAQIKCVIDRLHNPVRDSFAIKKVGLLACGGSSKPHIFEPLKAQFEVIRNYFGLESAGVVTAFGAREKGEVDETYLSEARKMGEIL